MPDKDHPETIVAWALAAVGGITALQKAISWVADKIRARWERFDGMEERAQQQVLELQQKLEQERERATVELANQHAQCLRELADVRANLARIEGQMNYSARLNHIECQIQKLLER